MSDFDYWIAACEDCDHACRAESEPAVIEAFTDHGRSAGHTTAQIAHLYGVRLDYGELEIGITP